MFDTYKCYCSKHALLLGDKLAKRDVYVTVYSIPSYLIYLLATGIFHAITSSLSKPHYMRLTVKSIFLLASLICYLSETTKITSSTLMVH